MRLPSLALIVVLLGCSVAFAGEGEWERYSDKDGVTVDWRTVDGARVREIRATGTVPVGLERLLSVLRDVEHYPEFMPPTEKVEVMHVGPEGKRLHITINPSWISRRDYCIDVTWSRFPDGSVGSRWVQVDDGCPPPEKGVVRHIRTDGTWRLRAVDENHTWVEYQAVTDPGGSVPAFLINRGTAKAMRGMFQALVRRASDPRYAIPDGAVRALAGTR